jgi:hypothetical protein
LEQDYSKANSSNSLKGRPRDKNEPFSFERSSQRLMWSFGAEV